MVPVSGPSSPWLWETLNDSVHGPAALADLCKVAVGMEVGEGFPPCRRVGSLVSSRRIVYFSVAPEDADASQTLTGHRPLATPAPDGPVPSRGPTTTATPSLTFPHLGAHGRGQGGAVCVSVPQFPAGTAHQASTDFRAEGR